MEIAAAFALVFATGVLLLHVAGLAIAVAIWVCLIWFAVALFVGVFAGAFISREIERPRAAAKPADPVVGVSREIEHPRAGAKAADPIVGVPIALVGGLRRSAESVRAPTPEELTDLAALLDRCGRSGASLRGHPLTHLAMLLRGIALEKRYPSLMAGASPEKTNG